MANKPMTKVAKNYMVRTLQEEPEVYSDCGEWDCTKLAEDTCNTLDLYIDGQDIPEWLFDMAVDVSEIVPVP